MLQEGKISQAALILDRLDIDLWITFVRESRICKDPVLDFLIDSDITWVSAFLVDRFGGKIAIVGKLDGDSIKDLGIWDVREYVLSINTELERAIKSLRHERIAINFSIDSEIGDGLSHGMYIRLKNLLDIYAPNSDIVSAEMIISELREIKTSQELAMLKTAINITQRVYGEIATYIRPGLSERDIASKMIELTKSAGVTVTGDERYCPAVFSGPADAQAHYAPTDNIIKRGHVLSMDFGVVYNHYCSDIQRCFYILNEGEVSAPLDVQRGFEVILESVRLAFNFIKPGVLGCEVDAIAREYIVRSGYPEFPHALGHQVGREVHDGFGGFYPHWERYGSRPDVPVKVGQVYTIEPRLPVPGRGVVTIEEEILVTPTGAEWLSAPQTELILIG